MTTLKRDVILPYAWNGQRGCCVGPFRDAKIAHFFARDLMEADSGLAGRVYEADGAWFIQVPRDGVGSHGSVCRSAADDAVAFVEHPGGWDGSGDES